MVGDRGNRQPSRTDRGAVALRSTTGACPATRSWFQCSTSPVSPTTHVLFGTEDATAPRSVRYGRRFRGSREGSLHSPARDPRLFHRPLRGRGIVHSAVATSSRVQTANSSRFIKGGAATPHGELCERRSSGRFGRRVTQRHGGAEARRRLGTTRGRRIAASLRVFEIDGAGNRV